MLRKNVVNIVCLSIFSPFHGVNGHLFGPFSALLGTFMYHRKLNGYGAEYVQYPVTTINHVADQLQKVSDELAHHPEWKPYLQCSGTFNWRVVAGTNYLSPHSFAIAIDIGVSKANYWRWDNRGASETDTIKYRNSMLKEIVDIFERHGFIWGGYWYHYDTMHFEYRPELLRFRQLLTQRQP